MKHKLTVSTLLLVALFLTLAPIALAATWYVNGVSGSDSHNCMSSTPCKTIGHAIALASSGDSIIVSAATYKENLTISKSLKIMGSGANTTIIDGGYSGTVVFISNAAANVTLSSLTIQHGSSPGGGGIYNYGILMINTSTVASNSVFSQSNYPSFGGGIYNNNKLTLNNSTISANNSSGGFRSSGKGGGVYNGGGTATMKNSTINGNGANLGGGIYNNFGTLTINNSTVSGNVAASRSCLPPCTFSPGIGGGIYNSGTLLISNNTISGNSASSGGGINGTATLQNSIIANNSGTNCGSGITSHGYNLSSDYTCKFSNSGDRNGLDPKLGTLGPYGGPTQTIPLLSGSPAIDAGNPSGCKDSFGNLLKTDQRGHPRPDSDDTTNPRCDMGAYESD